MHKFQDKKDGNTWRGYGRFLFFFKFFKNSKLGLSYVELLIVMGIITVVSTITMLSFTGYNSTVALRRSTRELGLGLREAQNRALAVTGLASGVTPPAYGLNLTQSSRTYFIFADLSPSNKYYTGSDVRVGQNRIFDNRVTVGSIVGQLRSPGVVNITFASPEADITLMDSAGNSLGEWVEINLTSGGVTKKVIVRTSGQISIK